MQVTRDESFKADVRAQRLWCVRHKRRDYLVGLKAGLRRVAEDLAEHPLMGQARGDGIRELLLTGRLPFVVWYSVTEDPDTARISVRLEALFHTSQDRPMPAE